MNRQDSSLATQIEELFIQFFKTNEILREYEGKHYEEDSEANTPDIMIKAVVNKSEDSISPELRLYKAEVDIKMRGNIGKVTVEGFDEAASVMEEMVDNFGDYGDVIRGLPAIAFFSMLCTIDEEGGNERDDDDKRRMRCRKIILRVKERS